jgi:hypothetical protein
MYNMYKYMRYPRKMKMRCARVQADCLRMYNSHPQVISESSAPTPLAATAPDLFFGQVYSGPRQ